MILLLLLTSFYMMALLGLQYEQQTAPSLRAKEDVYMQ